MNDKNTDEQMLEGLKDMMIKKSWSDFQKSGLLWWINRTLHLFGWAIIFKHDDKGNIIDVYPERVKWRGFPPEIDDAGFKKVHNYLNDNLDNIMEETE